MHLTGVDSNISAKQFYSYSKDSKLSTSQFFFSNKHPYDNARKKLPCLAKLPELTKSMVCVLKDISTLTVTYKIGLTNLEFTLGLTENVDFNGNKINDFFLPMTLRVKGKSIENSSDGNFVDFIFVKDAASSKPYSNLIYYDEKKECP